MNIASILINTSYKYGNKIGVIHNKKEYTWNMILNMVYKMSNLLQEKGAISHDKIGIDLPYGIESFISWYSISLLGCIAVPITKSKNLKTLTTKLIINDEMIKIFNSFNNSKSIKPLIIDEFCIINTSGTTDLPKGVLISNKNIIFQIKNKIKIGKLDKNTIYFHICSHDHVAYFSTYAVTMVGGMHIFDNSYRLKRQINDNISLSQLLNKYKVNFLVAVPAMLWTIKEIIESMKIIITGGGLLSDNVKIKYKLFPNAKWYHTFGSTECSSTIAMKNIELSDNYKIMDDIIVSIKENRFIIKGDNVAIGYIYENKDRLYEIKKFNGLFHSNDVGKIIDNELFFKHRLNMIKTGGKCVYSHYIENIIKKCDGIIDCNVYGEKDDYYGEIVVCNIWSNINIEDKIRLYCKKHLDGFMIPKKFNFIINKF